MRLKFAWILFSIMALAVIVLSSIIISYGVRWKSGDELLDIDIEDVESVCIILGSGSKPWLSEKEIELNESQIDYMINEFHKTKFKRINESYDELSRSVIIKLKDGSEKRFIVWAESVKIEDKQYYSNSYLTNFLNNFSYYDE